MKAPKGIPCHQCAPAEWRRTPNLTGSYELDAVIHRNGNKNIPDRLAYYLDCGGNPGQSYGPRTAYNGYHNYAGDS